LLDAPCIQHQGSPDWRAKFATQQSGLLQKGQVNTLKPEQENAVVIHGQEPAGILSHDHAYLLEWPVQLVKSLTHELEYGTVQQHPCKLFAAAYTREVTQHVVSGMQSNS
jgi:hypothetical protein